MNVYPSPRARTQRGAAFPSPLVMLSIVAIAMASFAFVATRDAAPAERKITTAAATASETNQPTQTTAVAPTKKAVPKPPVNRGEVYVEVFNNSGIKGLAAVTGDKATQVGWQVVGEDNWYGAIPASTVYYPPRLKAAAKQFALDLGIARTSLAVEPMKMDRLTVVLTGDAA